MAERSIARSSAVSVARASTSRAKRRGAPVGVCGSKRLIKAFWPAWTVLALAVGGLILMGRPRACLPRELHYALLAALAAALILFLTVARGAASDPPAVRGRQARPPGRRRARAVRRRPSTTRSPADRAIKGSEALWAAHQLQLAKQRGGAEGQGA